MSAMHDENTTVSDVGSESGGQDVAQGSEARDTELAKAEVAVQVSDQT